MLASRTLFVSIMGTPDVVPPGHFDDHPEGEHDAAWMCARLASVGIPEPRGLRRVDVCADEPLPPVDEIDAVVVGGSYHNVDEGRGWQQRTQAWLCDWRATGRPMLGICGGHQMAAVVLGGRVEPMARGPWAGTARVRLTEAGRGHWLFSGMPAPLVHLGHHDHVSVTPPGATLLAERLGVVEALDFGGGWLGVQFHPECSDTILSHAWTGAPGDLGAAWRPSGDGARILHNFFTRCGLIAAAGVTDQSCPV